MESSMNHSSAANETNAMKSEEKGLDLIDFQIVFLIITIIATVLGNALVLAAIFLDIRLRNVTNYFVACLAVSDLLVACFSVTIRLHQYLDVQSELNIHICRFWHWMDVFCESASIFTLTVISIDRYIKISRPFHYREKMTKTIAIAIILSIWACAGLVATLGLFPYAGAKGVTVPNCQNNNMIFYTLAAVVAFFFPLAILIIMYTLIFRIALYHFRKSNAVTLVDAVTGKQLHYSAHKDLKATRTLFIVVSTFIICWGPFFTLFLILQYHPSALTGNTRTLLSVIFFIILPYANSFFNPIIYACFDKVYRRSFRKILLKLVGRSEYLSDYGGQRARRGSRSVFELAPTRQSIIHSHHPPSVPEDISIPSKKPMNGELENIAVRSPSWTLTTIGSKETDVML